MALEFKPKKPLPPEVQRLMSEQIARIAKHLESTDPPEEKIHDIRKRIKETRALLRLLRPALGAQFAIENAWYREAARELARARDAAALVESIDKLRKRAKQTSTRRSLATVRRALRESPRANANLDGLIANLLAQLPYAQARLSVWPQFKDGFATIGDGIERTFRDGRRALRIVIRDYTPEHFHEFRKRVKDHWYQSQMLRRIWPDIMKPYTEVIEVLSDALGNHHDLIMLRQTLTEAPGEFGDETTLLESFAAIEEWRDDLEKKAITMAGPIYSEKPSQWRDRIRRYWVIAAGPGKSAAQHIRFLAPKGGIRSA